jgi:hypothetical protein
LQRNMNVEERIHNGEIRRFLHLTREKNFVSVAMSRR